MMKDIRISLVIFGLFLMFLLGFPKGIAVSFSLALAGFCLSALFFYKNPGALNSKTIRYLRTVLIMLFLYSLLFLLIKTDITIFCITLAVLLLYLIFREKGRKIHQHTDNSQEGRRALRTGLCFDVELRSLGNSNFSCRGVTKDLSTTGMKVFASLKLAKGDEFYFRLYLPEENWPLTGEAKVVWGEAVKDGFEHGLIFTKISEQNRGKLALKQGFSLLE